MVPTQHLVQGHGRSDRILSVANDSTVVLRDAGDLRAEARVVVEVFEEIARVPIDTQLVGRYEAASDIVRSHDVFDGSPERLGGRAERDVIALQLRVEPEHFRPAREQRHHARAARRNADEDHPLGRHSPILC
jgi:hypothetical protein